MGDDPKRTSTHDDKRINVDEGQELRYWAEKFGVTPEEVRSAVSVVGPMVKDVRRRLGANRSY